MRRPRRLGVAATLLLLLVPGCEEPGRAAHGHPPVPVEVLDVAPTRLEDWIELVGELRSEASVLLKPEIAGVVASIEFVEGQAVRHGDVLVRLRDEEQLAILREAEAKNELARDAYERTRKLARQNVSAAAELDRARAEFAVSRAAVELARLALDRTKVRAPFDGVVDERLVDPGDRVTDDTALVQIDAIDRLQLAFAIPELGVSVARVGLRVTLRVASLPGEEFAGEVFFVAPTLDTRSRQLRIKAWVPNPERRLRPGLFANLRIRIGERTDALVVPESAIAYDVTGPYVWRVADGDVAERVAVTLGTRDGGRVEIVSGLKAGDRIVAAGVHRLSSGAPLAPRLPVTPEPPQPVRLEGPA
ncbi:MAG: efflux RND transporter periplasmic adaptor subunit [Myxococcota bacterium]